jgi:hypothetical protein
MFYGVLAKSLLTYTQNKIALVQIALMFLPIALNYVYCLRRLQKLPDGAN